MCLFAAMLSRAGSWRSIAVGFALVLLTAGAVTVCVGGQPDAGSQITGEPNAAISHDLLDKAAGPEGAPAMGMSPPASHGEGHRHNCCEEYATPATYAAAQRPDGQAALVPPEPALAGPLVTAPPRTAMDPGPPAASPSLIKMSISRT